MSADKKGRVARFIDLPEFNVFIFAVLLNYPWEFLQAPLYRGMATADHWYGVKICTRATLGDGVIMLIAFWAVAAVSRSRWWLLRPDRRQVAGLVAVGVAITRSEEHTSELQSLMRISYAVFCLKKNKPKHTKRCSTHT